jgi:transcription antitermination factor NusG
MKNPSTQKKWHVIYTRSRAEKKVCTELTSQNIECFLPLQKKLRQWKDRKKWIKTPLISGYCFVNINRKEYDQVLQTNNVVCYITFEGKAAIIPQQQIDSLKKILDQSDFEVTVSPDNFEPGQIVEIISGPMIGLKGELVKCQNKSRFHIRVEQIKTVFSVEVPAEKLTALPESEKEYCP